MSILLEIETAADMLPLEQQTELVTFLSARLARANDGADGHGNSRMDLQQEFSRLTQQWRGDKTPGLELKLGSCLGSSCWPNFCTSRNFRPFYFAQKILFAQNTQDHHRSVLTP